MATAVPTEADDHQWLTQAVRDAFADPVGLAARQRLYRYETPPLDAPGVVADSLADVDGPILDVGCGNGRYFDRLRRGRPRLIVGVDMSHPMLLAKRAATGHEQLVAADAAALPFADACAEGVIAAHLLYLARDPSAAMAELARVLAPGGVFVVVTTAEDDKRIVQQLLADGLAGELPPQAVRDRDIHQRFTVDRAILTMRALRLTVSVLHLRGEIRLPDVSPLLGYIGSLRSFYVPAVSAARWDAAFRHITATAAALAGRDGLTISTHVGVLVGRRARLR